MSCASRIRVTRSCNGSRLPLRPIGAGCAPSDQAWIRFPQRRYAARSASVRDRISLGSPRRIAPMTTLIVNGSERRYDGDPDMPLLWYLRDELGLTGTKFGCGVAACGACTIHLDGTAVRACQTPVCGCRRPDRHDHRGLVAGWRPPGPGGLARPQRVAMRLLPDRADHAGRLAPQGHAEPDGRGHRHRHERQHLPLRHLSAHPRRHQAGGQGSPAMTEHVLDTTGGLANVSRRALLAGVGAGVFVLAVGLPTAVPAPGEEVRRRRHAERLARRSRHLHRDRRGRHRHRDLPSLRDGPGRAHLDRHGGRRRARGRLGAGPRRAGVGRRGTLRQPGHRRLALLASLLHADAPRGRGRAHDAGAGGGRAMGRAGLRGAGGRPCRRARRERAQAWLRRARRKPPRRCPCPTASTVRSSRTPSAFRYIGKDAIGLVDNRDITTGKAIYGIDARAEGMLHAVVARPPVYGGKVASYDAAEALKVPGVVKVVAHRSARRSRPSSSRSAASP